MGNHCIDVACMDCGRAWDARAYNARSGDPDAERAARLQRQYGEGGERPYFMSSIVCDCSSKRVVMT